VVQANRFTIQIGANAHLDPISDNVSPWGSLNHGCDPNVVIDVGRRVIVAKRPISAGEELRFDYNTTEWELAESFVCRCGAPMCVGVAMGFAHLSPAKQQQVLHDAASHIQDLYAAQTARRRPRAAISASLGIKTTLPPPPVSAG
jgi:hypothetical protein